MSLHRILFKNHGQRKAGNGSRKSGPVNTKRPRVLSLKFAKHARHGVALYSNVQSRSRGTRIIHTVTGAKRGRKLRFRCSCESASFRPRTACIPTDTIHVMEGRPLHITHGGEWSSVVLPRIIGSMPITVGGALRFTPSGWSSRIFLQIWASVQRERPWTAIPIIVAIMNRRIADGPRYVNKH
jgi:hypothetical protein